MAERGRLDDPIVVDEICERLAGGESLICLGNMQTYDGTSFQENP